MSEKILLFIFLFFYSLVTPKPLMAQDSFSLSLYPPLLEVTSKPDQTITQTYKIGNGLDKDIEVLAQIVPFKPVGEDGGVGLSLEKLTPDRSINWFTLENTDKSLDQPFLLKATSEEELVLRIQIPPDAAYKDYYYSLLVRTNPQISTTGQVRTVISPALGSHILLSVSEATPKLPDLEIAHFGLGKSLLANLVDSFDDVGFEIVSKNMGKHFAKMEGQIVVGGTIGQTRQKLELLPLNVLAFSSREAACIDSPDCRLPHRLLIGRFQAKLTLNNQGQTKEQSFYFYVLPVKLGGLVVLGIILVIGLPKMIASVLKRYIKK